MRTLVMHGIPSPLEMGKCHIQGMVLPYWVVFWWTSISVSDLFVLFTIMLALLRCCFRCLLLHNRSFSSERNWNLPLPGNTRCIATVQRELLICCRCYPTYNASASFRLFEMFVELLSCSSRMWDTLHRIPYEWFWNPFYKCKHRDWKEHADRDRFNGKSTSDRRCCLPSTVNHR